MTCGIDGRIVEARVIERGCSTAPGCSSRSFPILVEHQGRRVWVYDDEIDCRVIPTDQGPMRPRQYA